MKRVVFVPTSHIAEQSIATVRQVIEDENPDCVAVELDTNRFFAMQRGEQSNTAALKTLGPTTFFVYFFMKNLQSWLGKKAGIFPGTEMLGAVKAAREKDITVVFIDKDIRLTFMEIKKMPAREKFKLLWFLVKASFAIPLSKFFGSSEKIDLRKIPEKEVISEAMTLFRKELPYFYRILVSERDRFMAQRINELLKRFDKIVVVIGAGHYRGIIKLLETK